MLKAINDCFAVYCCCWSCGFSDTSGQAIIAAAAAAAACHSSSNSDRPLARRRFTCNTRDTRITTTISSKRIATTIIIIAHDKSHVTSPAHQSALFPPLTPTSSSVSLMYSETLSSSIDDHTLGHDTRVDDDDDVRPTAAADSDEGAADAAVPLTLPEFSLSNEP